MHSYSIWSCKPSSVHRPSFWKCCYSSNFCCWSYEVRRIQWQLLGSWKAWTKYTTNGHDTGRIFKFHRTDVSLRFRGVARLLGVQCSDGALHKQRITEHQFGNRTLGPGLWTMMHDAWRMVNQRNIWFSARYSQRGNEREIYSQFISGESWSTDWSTNRSRAKRRSPRSVRVPESVWISIVWV